MDEHTILVPTYYGNAATANGEPPEFGDPAVPVVIRPDDGVRIVLGSHDSFADNAPNIQIKRRPHGWAVFLHPVGGGDPSGCVYFIDDGRSFVVPERALGATPPITALDWDETVHEIDET